MRDAVRELIADSFRLARIIGDDEDPDSTQFRTGTTVLSDLLADWQTGSEIDWLRASGWFLLTAGERMYRLGKGGDFGERPVEIFSVTVDTGYTNSSIPIELVDFSTFTGLPSTSIGRPTTAYLEKAADSALLYLWPTPSAEGVIRLQFQREFEALDIPREWVRAVKYNLARDLCPRYGLPVSKEIENTAAEAKYEQGSNNIHGGTLTIVPYGG